MKDLLHYVFLEGRSSTTWKKYNAANHFVASHSSAFKAQPVRLSFITIVFSLLLCLKIRNVAFHNVADEKRRIEMSLASMYDSYLPWLLPGPDYTWLTVFMAGAKKICKFRKTTRPKIPITPPQLLMIVISGFPEMFNLFGQTAPDVYKQNYLSRAAFITIVLFLTDGLRGGELLAQVQKDWKPQDLRSIPRIDQMRFYFPFLDDFLTLGDFKTKRQQLILLRTMVENTDAFIVVLVLFTKPGRDRPVLFHHFHIFNSCLLCPICVGCNYLIHRLLTNNRPLVKHDFLFVFRGVGNRVFPFTIPIFDTVLAMISSCLGFYKITKHNFKIGILSELWETCLRNMSSYNPDIRFFLQVADHVTDYHQAYIVPDLRLVNDVLQDSRAAHLHSFINTLNELDRTTLLLKIFELTPIPVQNVCPHPAFAKGFLSRCIREIRVLEQAHGDTSYIYHCTLQHFPLRAAT